MLDGEAHKQHTLREYLAGESSEPVRAAFTIDGVTTYGDWHVTGTTVMCMFGVPKANNRATAGLMTEAMDRYVGPDAPDLRFTVTPRMRINPDRARTTYRPKPCPTRVWVVRLLINCTFPTHASPPTTS